MLSDAYSCLYGRLVLDCDTNTTNVLGATKHHLQARSRFDVSNLEFLANALQTLNEIPLGLGKVFSNLVSLNVMYNQIIALTNRDMKQFAKLRFLFATANNITELRSDTFINNPKLEFLSLDFNKITRVGSNVFGSLKKLKTLYMYHNPCKANNAIGDIDRLQLIKNQVDKCPRPKAINMHSFNQYDEFEFETLQDEYSPQCFEKFHFHTTNYECVLPTTTTTTKTTTTTLKPTTTTTIVKPTEEATEVIPKSNDKHSQKQPMKPFGNFLEPNPDFNPFDKDSKVFISKYR